MELKVGLLADEAGNVGEMQQLLDDQAKELDSTKPVLEAKEYDIKQKSYDCRRLKMDVKPARAAIKRGERVMQTLPSGLIWSTPR